MKAWLLEGLGGLDKLKLSDSAPDPRAGDGDVVLHVHYAALNPADRYLCEGQYPARPTFPHILGRDGMGDVIEVGGGVSGGWKVGDRALVLRSDVGVNRPGTLAEKVAVPAESLARIPAGWDEKESAAGALVYLTAYQALTQFGELPRGSVVLITGASGGVGVASIHLAAAMGLRPIGLSRGTSKVEALKKFGAVGVFDPNDATWRKKLKESLAVKVDLAIDNIGGELFNDIIDTLGNNGKVSVVGRLAGPVPQFNTASLLFRRITIRGVVVSGYTAAESQQVWAKVVSLLDSASKRPVVDSVYPFERLLDAFERLRQGPLGKVLLQA
jgi:NADPH2:quinone reductase